VINKYTIKLEFYKMRIDTLLNETQFLPSTDTISFSDLTPIQLNILRKLNDGLLDYETATPREQLTIDELEDLGLVVQGMLSPAGEKMVDVANSSGYSSYAREAGQKSAKLSSLKGKAPSEMDDVESDEVNSVRF
jgi:hypothetical protein